jgi:hypothetical protein
MKGARPIKLRSRGTGEYPVTLPGRKLFCDNEGIKLPADIADAVIFDAGL